MHTPPTFFFSYLQDFIRQRELDVVEGNGGGGEGQRRGSLDKDAAAAAAAAAATVLAGDAARQRLLASKEYGRGAPRFLPQGCEL